MRESVVKTSLFDLTILGPQFLQLPLVVSNNLIFDFEKF